jgi:hypothetical protein
MRATTIANQKVITLMKERSVERRRKKLNQALGVETRSLTWGVVMLSISASFREAVAQEL